jgi:hypothetical protein
MLNLTYSRFAVNPPNVPDMLRRAWALNPMLTLFWCSSLATLALGVWGLIVDPRLIVNAPAWAKTTKFSISFILYTPTMLWMLSLVKKRWRWAYWVGTAIGAILLLEMVLIVAQAVRGQAMHFNVSTPFNAALWTVMSVSIMVFYLFFLAAMLLLWRQFMGNALLMWSVRLGILITFLGFGQGFLMTGPTPAQQSELMAGHPVAAIGAHTVNATDGGPGLPLLGWSTTHGDLRIGHFVGIHALQVIPLLGFLLLSRRERWLTEGDRVRLVWIGAAGYWGLMGLVTWQALRDQPIVAPDRLTWSALVSLLASVLGMATVVVGWAKRRVVR